MGQSKLWDNIRVGAYGWLEITEEKRKRLLKLIEIYKEFYNLVENVEILNAKVDKFKKLKETSDDDNN